jgi:integrase
MNAPLMTSQVERYLALRRAMGFELCIAGRQLMQFARFVDTTGVGVLRLEVISAWANAARNPTALSRARRIEVIRPFVRYLKQLDPAHEVPECDQFGRAHRRLTPHIFSSVEIEQLLVAAMGLSPTRRICPLCFQTLFGLIACTGLRLGEALRLTLHDADLAAGMLTLRRTKFHKTRLVALHPTAIEPLSRYRLQRNHRPALSECFFVDRVGAALTTRQVDYVFKKLCAALHWKPRGGHRAIRITDLRHSFITRRLALWQANGTDIDHAALALSTYVGHAKVTDTYWYLTATPELMQTAGARFETFAQGGHDG